MSKTRLNDEDRDVCPDCSEPLVHLSEQGTPWCDFTAKYFLQLITREKVIEGEGPQYICMKCLLRKATNPNPNNNSVPFVWQYKMTTREAVSPAGPRRSGRSSVNAKNLTNTGGLEAYQAVSKNSSKIATPKKIVWGKFKCEQCERVFNFEHSLEAHKLLHDNSRRYACETCHLRFTKSTHLVNHQSVHSRKKQYKCSICQKKFKSQLNLVMHKRVHKDKSHQCTECGKSFFGFYKLKTHLRVHTGEKPYACDICNRTFRVSSKLSQHRRTHAGEKK